MSEMFLDIPHLQVLEDYFWLPDLEFQKKYRQTKPRSLDLGGLSTACDKDGKPDLAFGISYWIEKN